VARQDSCPAQLPEIASRLASYTQLPANDEGALYEALKTGPIDVAITVDTPFMEYSGGVFSSDSCGGTPNHMVLVVGAGRDDELGVDYWLIRNRCRLLVFLAQMMFQLLLVAVFVQLCFATSILCKP
jgi:hypothetical protein